MGQKKQKRHIVALALAAALLIGICGCQKTGNNPSGNDANATTQQGTTDSPNTSGDDTNKTNPSAPDGQSPNANPSNSSDNSGNSSNSSDPNQPHSPSDSTDPNASANGATEGNSAVVYVPSEQADLLTPVGTSVADDSDQALVDALIQAGSLPEGVEVLSAAEKDGILTLDMNQAFADAVRSSGSAGEAMLIYSLVNTFIQAHDVEKVMLTVNEGGLLESGHEVYDYPLEMSYLE